MGTLPRVVHGILHALTIMIVVAVASSVFATDLTTTSDYGRIDWHWVAKLNPELKVLVLIEGDREITLQDLARLADRGLIPADRDPGLAVGLSKAVFATKLNKWMNSGPLPEGLTGRILERFIMSGIYRTALRVEDRNYVGPLTIAVTAPRNGFGRRLLSSSVVVRPPTEGEIQKDEAGNRWFYVQYPEVQAGSTAKFHFSFKYEVDMVNLLDHDLMLSPGIAGGPMPEETKVFLERGHKIDPRLPPALAWAGRARGEGLDIRKEYQRLVTDLKRRVRYDYPKRHDYFGGRSVYYDLDDMYQPITQTLSSGVGACPDTSLIECAFLRARGIPCRTAGRFGHFFSLVYVPERGWMSTSVTPTGIPLIIAPGPDNVPHQRWHPRIAMRTTVWEARVRIEPVEE